MGKKKSRGDSSKSGKSKKHKEKNSREKIYEKEEENSKKIADEVYNENVIQESEANDASDLHTDASASKTSSDTNLETDTNNTTNIDTNANINADTSANTNMDIADCCEEIKAKQEELFNRLKNLSEALVSITLIRDDVNSLRVDTLTELYFTRQVRPLLDALNIISFATSNVSNTATAFQSNAFGDAKEIKHALKLSYKMNGEVDDIINALGRRLTIFLKEINNMDKNCPPFYSGKDS